MDLRRIASFFNHEGHRVAQSFFIAKDTFPSASQKWKTKVLDTDLLYEYDATDFFMLFNDSEFVE